jgi:NTE family protein
MMAVLERLRSLAYFRQLEPRTVEAIAERGVWISHPGGWALFSQNDHAESMFFALSGRLIVVRRGAFGEEVIGYINAGEPVGEMSMLSGEPRSASVYALRDTELLEISHADFEALLDESPDFARALARSVLQRSRHPHESFRRSAPRVFALIATSPSLDVDWFARDLTREIARHGMRARWISEVDEEKVYAGFEEVETAHDVVILTARVADTTWYKFVLRHADRFLVLARWDARPAKPFPLSLDESSPSRKFRLVDLVMVREGTRSCAAADWADAIGADRVFHLGGAPAIARLARVIAGKSVGLVLSGGGARAYAHIGAVKAMRERGAPIDFVAGASMGAIIGACVGMGWSDAEIEMRIRDAFVSSNPLGDHVLPVVALTRGKLVEARLKKHFGDALIEDLHTPFFCVSSDLAAGVSRIHRFGLLRTALRASISLPGILPPIVDGDALLVDGAVIDNFPTALMARFHRGMTVGIDVAQRGSISAKDFVDPPNFFAWVFNNGFKSAPPIVSLLMRAATAREETMHMTHPADILITPEVPGVELRDWKKFDLAVADGYKATMKALDERWGELGPIVEAARAVGV